MMNYRMQCVALRGVYSPFDGLLRPCRLLADLSNIAALVSHSNSCTSDIYFWLQSHPLHHQNVIHLTYGHWSHCA